MMSRSLAIVTIFLPLILPIALACQSDAPVAPRISAASPARVEVAFSPGGHCTDLIVKLIGEARKTIRVQAYSFSSKPIALALIDARRRGVDVQAVLDRSNLHDVSSEGRALTEAGIPVVYDHIHAIAHNKVIVLDSHLVIGGSFNYSASAETANAENVTITKSVDVAQKFADNWILHAAHSEPAPSN